MPSAHTWCVRCRRFMRGRGLLPYDEGVLADLLNDIGKGPIRPAVFGTYTDLVESILADNAGLGQATKRPALGSSPVRRGALELLPSPMTIWDQVRPSVTQRLIDDDPSRTFTSNQLPTRLR